jgi:hypothetical protein
MTQYFQLLHFYEAKIDRQTQLAQIAAGAGYMELTG